MHMNVHTPWNRCAEPAFGWHGNLVLRSQKKEKQCKEKKLELEVMEATFLTQQGSPTALFLCCFLLLCDFCLFLWHAEAAGSEWAVCRQRVDVFI